MVSHLSTRSGRLKNKCHLNAEQGLNDKGATGKCETEGARR